VKLILWEVRKLWSDQTARVGVVVVTIALAAALVTTALTEVKKPDLPEGTRGRDVILAMKDTHNGWNFASSLLMPFSGFVMPVVLLIVMSNSIAGEAEKGTLAEPCARGVSPSAFVAGKLAAGGMYALVLVVISAVVALVLAPLMMGTGPIPPIYSSGSMLEQTELLDGQTALVRLCAAYGASFLGSLPVLALGVMMSAMTRNSRTAALSGTGVYLSLMLLNSLPGTADFRPYLLVDRLTVWRVFLSADVGWGQALYGVGVIAISFALLVTAAIMSFSNRDHSPESHSVR
jgi:ABC-type transport system involved in multi-copper enzyme maturation permease subunit